jgi:hypothetical protein
MVWRTQLNALQALEAAEAARVRKALGSSLRLVALIVLGIFAVMVLGNLHKLRTDNNDPATAQAVEQIAAEAPEAKQAEFDQRFDQESKETARPGGIKIDREPETQAKRKTLLQGLSNEGVFIKAELPGGVPWVWVGPAFYTLDFETKRAAVGIVYSYYLDGSDPIANVRIFDGQTNKEIGDYNMNSPDGTGLRLF